MKRASISLRLTAWFASIFLLGALAFGAAMWLNLKRTLTEERYSTLARRLERLQDLLKQTKDEDPADRDQEFKDFAHATGNGLSEIFRQDGSRALPSPSSAARAFGWPTFPAGSHELFAQIDSGGQPYWVLEQKFTLGGDKLVLASAAPASGNLLVLNRFWEGLIASVPVLLLISSAGGYWLSRRALRPVDQITATARSISIRNLAERLPASHNGDELDRLADTFNAMLVRLDSAVNQIKQFTGDASHELRGPLSFVRTVAEVALRNPKADKASRKAFEDIVEETAKAAILLEEMLTLARADADRGGMVMEPLNLADAVQEACDMARPLAHERHLAFFDSLGTGLTVMVLGDFSALRRLTWILLDNALKYTQSSGRIDVALTANDGRAAVVIRDNGAGIAETDLPRIFDRFYRADPSRSQIEGSGLGLAIAKWIAEMHNAELKVSSHLGEGTTFHLTLPLLTDAHLPVHPHRRGAQEGIELTVADR
ncbi:MAG: ATP-binding protein [Terracidiphilus sp.]